MQKKTLLVDDDKKAVDSRRKTLEKAGYKVTCSYDGNEAIDCLRKDQFGLVVLDLEMPRISGNEVLRIIREDPELKDTKVLVVTALSGEIQDRAKETGLAKRGWAGKFKLLAKWSKDGYGGSTYPGYRVDLLSGSALLQRVEEMFRFYEEVDRPKQPQETDKILISDNDRSSVEKIESILKEKGYEVVYAPDGESALKILGEKDIDLLIMDLDMPKLKGDQLMVIMGRNFVLENIPVVIFTGLRDFSKGEESLRKTVESGFYNVALFEKQKKRGFFKAKDTTYDVIKKIEELLNERKKMGWGYKKGSMAFIRDKQGDYVAGCIEGFRPIRADDWLIKWGDKKFQCNYCCQEKLKDEAMSTFQHDFTPGSWTPCIPSHHCVSFYFCLDCTKELARNYPNFGKWWQQQSKESFIDLIKRSQQER